MSNKPQTNNRTTSYLTAFDDSSDTPAVPQRPIQQGRAPVVTRIPEPRVGVAPEPVGWRLVLYVGQDNNLPITMNLNGHLLIGRIDPAQDFRPDFDLLPFGGQDAGVSRRHALLFASTNGLYIRDLGSTNGTQVNGVRLEPNQAYRLHEGDQLEIGHLPITLHMAHLEK